MSTRQRHSPTARQPLALVLVLSEDPVAAALLGGLVETLGYDVRFARPPEAGEDALRRVRPRICLVDCVDPAACSDEFIGRATMRGVSVVIFGRGEALDRVRALAREHRIDTLLMPPEIGALDGVLERARGS